MIKNTYIEFGKFSLLKNLLLRIACLLFFAGYDYLINYLFKIFILKNKMNEILISSRESNIWIALLINFVTMISIIIYIQSKIRISQIKKNRKNPNIFSIGSLMDYSEEASLKRIKKACVFITILIGVLTFYLANNYIVIYKDKVVITNIIKPLKKEYGFNEIKKLELRAINGKRDYTIYELILNSGKKIDISNSSLEDMINLNELIIEKQIEREIESYYLHEVIRKYDNESQLKYMKLFRY